MCDPVAGVHGMDRPRTVCQSIDWYGEGQCKTVSVNGEQIVVRYVGRKGRRGRICITAPAGVVFRGDMGTP